MEATDPTLVDDPIPEGADDASGAERVDVEDLPEDPDGDLLDDVDLDEEEDLG